MLAKCTSSIGVRIKILSILKHNRKQDISMSLNTIQCNALLVSGRRNLRRIVGAVRTNGEALDTVLCQQRDDGAGNIDDVTIRHGDRAILPVELLVKRLKLKPDTGSGVMNNAAALRPFQK